MNTWKPGGTDSEDPFPGIERPELENGWLAYVEQLEDGSPN